MRRFQISEIVAGFLFGFATLLVIFILSSDFAAQHEVCETTKEGAIECVRYGVVHLALHEIGAALDAYNGLMTAIATIFIAWFTFSLRRSTDKLWDAGERQIALARETSASQGRDMQASIAEALRAATAMENVAQGIDLSVKATQTSVATLRERTAMQMRAYVSVLINNGLYQERDKNLKFDVRPQVINTGHTPAHKLTYWATAEILPFPLPEDFTFPEGEDSLKAGFVLGPHQTIIANATVPDFVDDAEVAVIKGGRERRVYVWGIVFYEDAFGEPRHTRFCHNIFWINGPNGELVTGNYTGQHNDAD